MIEVPTSIEEVMALPFVEWAARGDLPSEPGLYFAVLDREHLAYVGITDTSLRKRWSGHHKAGPLTRRGDLRIHYMTTESGQLLWRAEDEAILRFKPVFNSRPAYRVGVEIRDGRKRLVVLSVDEGWSRIQRGTTLIPVVIA